MAVIYKCNCIHVNMIILLQIITEKPQPEVKQMTTEMNVEDMSDKELADELRALGFKPGPIGGTITFTLLKLIRLAEPEI